MAEALSVGIGQHASGLSMGFRQRQLFDRGLRLFIEGERRRAGKGRTDKKTAGIDHTLFFSGEQPERQILLCAINFRVLSVSGTL